MAQGYGSVQPLAHSGCGQHCRELCFEVTDPLHRVVRLTHGQWHGVLAKQNRAFMSAHLGTVEAAIRHPSSIDADPQDDRHFLYYSGMIDVGGTGRLLLVAVKHLPRRMHNARMQRRYAIMDRLLRNGWGEAWVSSAYLVSQPKPRGQRTWP